ncbi:hypothetical protein ACIOD2_42640 [Amycolatopsis sp. NPDC088138]|uniref:hypothetical protein n=1 Tax=Amycolatopsis sp. NPDC088138 TaxID=3363938 RepID=UPI0037F442EA
MKRIWGIPVVLFVLASSASCAAGDANTDREATTLAEAIASPRQPSALRYARAALDTPFGRSPRFSVLEARDLPVNGPTEVSTHLLFRIHHEGTESGWTSTDPVTACYTADFSYQGLDDLPHRVDCPPDAAPITPPPAPPPATVPGTSDAPLNAVLTALPATTTEADVLAALARAVPAPPPDPGTHLTPPAPAVRVAIRGTDVGVAYRAADPVNGIDCLLGSRAGHDVLVWRPSWREVQPGELTCVPEDALVRRAVTPPH